MSSIRCLSCMYNRVYGMLSHLSYSSFFPFCLRMACIVHLLSSLVCLFRYAINIP